MSPVIVRASARLALTLLDMNGGLGRVDGCVGLSLIEPQLVLECRPADTFEFIGIGSEYQPRLRAAAEKILAGTGFTGARFESTSKYGAHSGLGLGTQLLVGGVRALALSIGRPLSVREAAILVGRGATSGVGVALHESGGVVVDGGHTFGVDGEKRDFSPTTASRAPPGPGLMRSGG